MRLAVRRPVAAAAPCMAWAGITLAAFTGGELLSLTAFGIGQAILHGAQAGVSLGSGTALRAAFGGGLYLTAVGLLGYG